MAEYTMELRQIVNSDCHQVFDFTYPFYCDESVAKKEFEELFINRYYFHEIGAETIERWQHQLKARLMTIMPYYTQLYQTEWYNVKSKELMMTSKNVVDTFERELIEDGVLNSTSSHSNQSSQTNSNSNQLSFKSESSGEATSESSGTGQGDSHHKESNIQDGISVSLTDDGYLTGMSKDTTSSSSESQTSATSSDTTSNQQTSSIEGQLKSTGSNQSETNGNEHKTLIEKTTQKSVGDIGIQTPAYAITEWRKIIININEMILNDCKDLFMLIY